MYYIKGKYNTLGTSEKEEKAHDGYICIYEYVKHLLYSVYKCAWSAQYTTFSQIKNIVDTFNSEINEFLSTNRDIQTYIIICKKES